MTDIDAIEEAEVAALLRGDTRCVRGRTDQVGRLVRILAVVGATAVAASASTVPPPAVPQVEAAAIPEVPPEAPTDAPVFDERLMGMGYIE